MFSEGSFAITLYRGVRSHYCTRAVAIRCFPVKIEYKPFSKHPAHDLVGDMLEELAKKHLYMLLVGIAVASACLTYYPTSSPPSSSADSAPLEEDTSTEIRWSWQVR